MLEFCLESEIGKFGPTDWLRWWESIVRPGVELLTVSGVRVCVHALVCIFMCVRVCVSVCVPARVYVCVYLCLCFYVSVMYGAPFVSKLLGNMTSVKF